MTMAATLRGVDVGLEQPFDGMHRVLDADAVMGDRERHMPDAAGERPELRLVGRDLAGHRHGQERAAMEGALEADDVRAAGIGARDLDGVLDRFGAGRHEEALLVAGDRRHRIELLGQFDEGRIGRDHEAGVGEGVELLLDALHHRGMAVAGVDHGDAAAEIDEAAALDVPHLGILGARGNDRRSHADAARNRLGAPLNPGVVQSLGRCLDVHDASPTRTVLQICARSRPSGSKVKDPERRMIGNGFQPRAKACRKRVRTFCLHMAFG